MTDQQLLNNRIRLGQRFAQIREEKGLTLQQVEELTGLKRQNISRIEGGKYNVGIDILAKVAAALDCKIDIHV